MQIKDLSKNLGVDNKDLVAFFKENGFEVKNHMNVVTDEMEKLANKVFSMPKKEKEKEPRKYEPTDYILCRSITPGWLGMSGKSGQYYVFSNAGDEQEVEYQDLYSMKTQRSDYLYAPLIVIEDEELLEQPRWKDLADYYNESIYGNDNIDEILNVSVQNFKKVLFDLPKGLKKALMVEVAERIENGTFDSLRKINIIDDVCGTDFKHIIQ